MPAIPSSRAVFAYATAVGGPLWAQFNSVVIRTGAGLVFLRDSPSWPAGSSSNSLAVGSLARFAASPADIRPANSCEGGFGAARALLAERRD